MILVSFLDSSSLNETVFHSLQFSLVTLIGMILIGMILIGMVLIGMILIRMVFIRMVLIRSILIVFKPLGYASSN